MLRHLATNGPGCVIRALFENLADPHRVLPEVSVPVHVEGSVMGPGRCERLLKEGVKLVHYRWNNRVDICGEQTERVFRLFEDIGVNLFQRLCLPFSVQSGLDLGVGRERLVGRADVHEGQEHLREPFH